MGLQTSRSIRTLLNPHPLKRCPSFLCQNQPLQCDTAVFIIPPPPSHAIETSVKKRSATVEQARLVAGSLGLRTEHGFNAVVLGLLFLYPTITINRWLVERGHESRLSEEPPGRADD